MSCTCTNAIVFLISHSQYHLPILYLADNIFLTFHLFLSLLFFLPLSRFQNLFRLFLDIFMFCTLVQLLDYFGFLLLMLNVSIVDMD